MEQRINIYKHSHICVKIKVVLGAFALLIKSLIHLFTAILARVRTKLIPIFQKLYVSLQFENSFITTN